jgi:hypothetical protein
MRHFLPIDRLLFALAIAVAAVPLTASPSTLAFKDVNVVDVVQRRILPHTTVTIRGNTIASIESANVPLGNARVVDGKGGFLIPGLWDMHAHMEMVGQAWLQLYVASGVTCIRDMGSDLDLILKMRDATSSGRVLGPVSLLPAPSSTMPPENGRSECG